ncbi:MAG: DNA methylase [Desulfovibrionales bacterium GWA2_65_9]|nr:MAG: DNA methylase [Desulfovibrionales bacterium GWA2_65_9]
MPTLHWLTRETDLKLSGLAPYRLLEAVDEHSHGDPTTGNMLIQGDNLDALKALLPYYAGAVKCIFIDPPYNTKSAFEHYDDNLEHTKWLSLIYPRLELLRELLAENGSIWVSIDDNEAHYLKVIMDEVFGRVNFVANALWQKRTSPDARATISDAHDHILVYSKGFENIRGKLNKIGLTEEQRTKYKNVDNDPSGPWVSTDFTAQGYRPNQMYKITTPSGQEYHPPDGRCWANVEHVFLELISTNKIWFGKDGSARPRIKNYLRDAEGITAWTWWSNQEVGHNQESKKEINALFGAHDAFDTPKPERLLKRIIEIATNPGDLVLDSFLGSGTTAAVAHKMGRRYIGIEMGEHAVTHCAPRLVKVIEGEQGGISQAVNWQGGGGFRFYRLGEPIFDDDGSIRQGIKFAQLGAHVWFSETKTPLTGTPDSPLLGIHNGTAYYLLYNGILKDKSVGGGNVLTSKILEGLPAHDGPKVIYGERCLFSASRLKEKQITFKHTPYDIKGR